MNKIYCKFFVLLLISILLPRNIIQNWLKENKSFIQSPTKSINFTYSVSHPDYKSTYGDLKGQIITATNGRFKLTMGPRIVFSDGFQWVSYDSTTNQAIIQYPDSLMYNSIFSLINYKQLNKLLSVSILKGNKATIYNEGQKIDLSFNDNTISSIEASYNSFVFKIFQIKFDNRFVFPDSLFVFSDTSTMIIDLRE